MKIIFLDVDGVLNNETTTTKVSGFTGVDPELRDRFLNFLKQAPDVTIILSSTWRQFDYMKQGLYDSGVRWDGETVKLADCRGAEIQVALNHYKPTHYAILDDNSDMLPEQLPHFVQTDYRYGLQDKDVEKLKEILNWNPVGTDALRPSST